MTIQQLCGAPPGSLTDAQLEQILAPYWPITRRQVDSRLLARAKRVIGEAQQQKVDKVAASKQIAADALAKLRELGLTLPPNMK